LFLKVGWILVQPFLKVGWIWLNLFQRLFLKVGWILAQPFLKVVFKGWLDFGSTFFKGCGQSSPVTS
jgi:hypothetical protein